MSTRTCSLKIIEDLDEEGVRGFLKNNGMGPCLRIFELEKINGKAFLNLSKNDFVKWRKLALESEVKIIETFVNDVRENPQKFIKTDVQLKPLSAKRSTFYVNLELPDVGDNENRTFPLKNSRSSIKRSSLFFRGHKYSQPLKQCRFLSELEQKLAHRAENITVTDEQKEIPSNPKIVCHHDEESKSQQNSEISEDFDKPQQDYLDKPNDAADTHYLVPNWEKCRSKLTESKYYLNLDRNEADVYLKITGTDGSYLFRPSSRYLCALSVLFENEVFHVGVNCVENNKLELAINDNNLRFDSLDDIVEYFRKNPVQAAVQKNIKLIRHISKNKEL